MRTAEEGKLCGPPERALIRPLKGGVVVSKVLIRLCWRRHNNCLAAKHTASLGTREEFYLLVDYPGIGSITIET